MTIRWIWWSIAHPHLQTTNLLRTSQVLVGMANSDCSSSASSVCSVPADFVVVVVVLLAIQMLLLPSTTTIALRFVVEVPDGNRSHSPHVAVFEDH